MIGDLSLADVSALSTFVPLLVFIFYFKSLRVQPLRIIALLLLISILTEAVNIYLIRLKFQTLIVVNIYTIAEYALLAFFYYSIFSNPIKKKRIGLLLIIGLIITIVITFIPNLHRQLNNITLSIEALTFITVSLLYFNEMLKKMEYEKIWDNPYFWINSAILIYFSGSFFVFAFSDFRNYNKTFQLWNIHSICSLLFYYILAIGFWKARKITI